jgi:hypothetical protein
VSRQLAAAEGTRISRPVPEFIDPVFAKTSRKVGKRSFSINEDERFGLVFAKNWVYKFGHGSDDENCLHMQPLLMFMCQ